MNAREFPTQDRGYQYPFLHFFWVGPQPETFGGSIGHDTHRVLQWAKHIKKNPIVFWCLDKYTAHYRAKFTDTQVLVCSIEKFLAQPFLDPEDAKVAKHITAKKAQLLDHPHRNRITDRASMKEFVELFVLDYYGGFGLDTSTKPHPGLGDSLSPYKSVCMVQNTLPNNQGTFFDYWLLYAPSRIALDGKPRVSAKLLNVYINQFAEKEKIYAQRGYVEEYRQGCRSIITKFANEHALDGEVAFFPYAIDEITFTAIILNLIIKNYHNSHSNTAVLYDSRSSLFRHEFNQFLNDSPITGCGIEGRNIIFDYLTAGDLEDEKTVNPLIPGLASRIYKVNITKEQFWALKKGDTPRLIELLEAGANLSETVETDDLADATILHLSAGYPDIEQLKILLSGGADPRAKAKLKQLHQGQTLMLTPEIYARRLKNQLLHASGGEVCSRVLVLIEWINVIEAHTQELEMQSKAKRARVR